MRTTKTQTFSHQTHNKTNPISLSLSLSLSLSYTHTHKPITLGGCCRSAYKQFCNFGCKSSMNFGLQI
jgi:hypothetical protein